MDKTAFAVWTRRRFGLIAAGLTAAIAGLHPLDDAGAKKKRKKKRCKQFAESCKPGGKRKCCGKLRCDLPNGSASFSCCKDLGASCIQDEECCQDIFDSSCNEGTCQVI